MWARGENLRGGLAGRQKRKTKEKGLPWEVKKGKESAEIRIAVTAQRVKKKKVRQKKRGGPTLRRNSLNWKKRGWGRKYDLSVQDPRKVVTGFWCCEGRGTPHRKGQERLNKRKQV